MVKSSNTLIFMTYQYPYLPGEYFIESEMHYLAEHFQRVCVFPCRCLWWKAEGSSRPMPKGVELWNPARIPLLIRLLFFFVSILQAPFLVRAQQNAWCGRKDISKASWTKSVRIAFKTLVISRSVQWFVNKTAKNEVLQGYAYWRDSGAGALSLARDALNLRSFYTRAHRVDIYLPERWPNESSVHNLADKILPVSTNGRDYMVNYKGLPAEKIEVYRLGVKIPESVTRASTDGVLRIVSCSNMALVKRVDLIARVVASLPGPVEWTHIGDGPEIQAVEQVSDQFDSKHRVIFKGRLSNQEVYAYYQTEAVDVFINLSESEGVPVSIMEAMAHGIPCVATDVGGTAEIVNESNGAVLPVDFEVGDIRTVIEIVLNNKSARESARKQAELMCSADRNYREFCEMLVCDVG